MDDTPVAGGSPIRSRPPDHASPPSANRLAIIAAVARNGVIGAGNSMPWRLSADLKRFRALTIGHRVIMGRKTYQSLGKPLAGRENVVVSRDPGFAAPGCRVVGALADALDDPVLPPPAFCIGGAQLYAEALPLADEIHLTEIDADFDGDTYMPLLDPNAWREVSRESASDPVTGLRYAFVHLVRIGERAALASGTAGPN
jgi:dihydrofolate reductase